MAKKDKEKQQQEEEPQVKAPDNVLPESDDDLLKLVATFTPSDRERMALVLQLDSSSTGEEEAVPVEEGRMLVNKLEFYRLVRAVVQKKSKAYEGSAGLGRIARIICSDGGHAAGRDFYQKAQRALNRADRGLPQEEE